MNMNNRDGLRYAMLATAVLLLGGCEGDRGPAGPEGPPGPPGPPAAPPVVEAPDAATIEAAITGVTVSSPPVVDFTLQTASGTPVVNLPASAISFKIAKLTPGTDGNASAWQSYLNVIEEPGVGPGTEAKAQATTESGSNGSLVDNGDGSYQYTFATDIANVTAPVPVSFDPDLTHRVTFEVRGGLAPVRNPSFDFRPSDGATAGLFTRDIATMGTCNACHEDLSFHGGARFEVEDCVTCHNPGSADANSGNTIDMTVMTHKIHRGADLPSVMGGTDYCFFGFNDSLHCYGDVSHPQDIRNCQNCHDATNPETPDAANWYTQPTAESCGACHDDVNFETGENHGSGIPADNTGCVGCHASNPDSRLEVRQAHRIVTNERAAEYQYNILAIDFLTPGSAPMVTFSITNPLNGDAPYDLANDADLLASATRFQVAWDTIDFANWGNGGNNAQPQATNVFSNGALQATDNGDFTYSLTLATVASGATGSGVVNMEGRVESSDGRLPVETATRYFSITDDPAAPVARRVSVDIDRCNDCHADISFHGARNNNIVESCQTCHNANAARSGSPSNGPMDMKHFLHRKHAVDDIRYPQRISNCVGCHTDDGFYPVEVDSGVLATSFDRGTDPLDPSTNTRTSPNSAACGVCHSSADAQAHMIANGGGFDACLEPDGVLRQRVDFCGPGGDKTGALVLESCTVCHGPGRFSDVADAHGLND